MAVHYKIVIFSELDEKDFLLIKLV